MRSAVDFGRHRFDAGGLATRKEVPGSRLMALVLVATALISACGAHPAKRVSTVRSLSSPSFPAAVYPLAVAPHSGTSIEGDCASPVGVTTDPSAQTRTFTHLLNEAFHARSLQSELVEFDQAQWPDEVAGWTTPSPSAARLSYVARDVQVHAGWTESGTLEQLIGNACGSNLLQGTWIVSACYPGKVFAACDPGVTGTYGVIERSGTWLIWYVSSGYQGP